MEKEQNSGNSPNIQRINKEFNLVSNAMPPINEYVLVKTPYSKYPATVAYYNWIKWLAADDKCEIFNIEEWLSLK